jgi:Protein of unknown function (DUF3352)
VSAYDGLPPPPPPPPFGGQFPEPPQHPYPAAPDSPPLADDAGSDSKRSHVRRTVAGALVAVVVAGAVAGGILAFRFVRGTADTVVSMVPSDSALYANFNLDPPGSQKMALNDLFNKFPAVNSESQRDTWINLALDNLGAKEGFSHADVRPWLGPQLAVAAQATAFAPHETPSTGAAFAFLISSTDDGKAQAALDKLRGGAFSGYAWSKQTHDGVAETVGQGHGTPVVSAIVNHFAVLGGSTDFVNEVIDTAHGKHASLDSTDAYKTALSQLPADRLATMYVSVPELLKQLGSSSLGGAFGGTSASTQRALADAYRAIGAALVASSDGVAIDAVQDYDASKLPADLKALLAVPPDQNGALALVPAHAYGFLTITGLRQDLQSFAGAFSSLSPFGGGPTLDELGITGPNGVINHLTGDAGFEVDAVEGSNIPAGAFLFATDSAAAAQTFLDSLAATVCQKTSQCSVAQETKQTHSGVSITSLPFGSGTAAGVSPSWAVTGNWGVLASSADEVKAIIDSHSNGGISRSPAYTAISSHITSLNNATFYVDIQAVVAAIRKVLPAEAQTLFDTTVAPNLNPLKGLAITGTNSPDHSSSTLFLQIG